MNLKAITSALLIAGLAAPSAFASTGTITFTGSITNVTCTVDGGAPGNGPDFTVNIGAVNAADFANVGDTSGNVGLEIASDDTKTSIRPGVPFVVNALGTGRSYQFNTRLRETRPTVRGGEFQRPVLVQVDFF